MDSTQRQVGTLDPVLKHFLEQLQLQCNCVLTIEQLPRVKYHLHLNLPSSHKTNLCSGLAPSCPHWVKHQSHRKLHGSCATVEVQLHHSCSQCTTRWDELQTCRSCCRTCCNWTWWRALPTRLPCCRTTASLHRPTAVSTNQHNTLSYYSLTTSTCDPPPPSHSSYTHHSHALQQWLKTTAGPSLRSDTHNVRPDITKLRSDNPKPKRVVAFDPGSQYPNLETWRPLTEEVRQLFLYAEWTLSLYRTNRPFSFRILFTGFNMSFSSSLCSDLMWIFDSRDRWKFWI